MERLLISDQMKKIAIVNRSFWPSSPAIGEGLLLLSESLVGKGTPIVITQVKKGFKESLERENRGQGVIFSTLASFTSSSSHLALRVLELIAFSLFVLFSLCKYRPDIVYVATNPPVFTPMIVRWYCKFFSKKYIYHVQDIHPEATQIVTGKSNFITRFLFRIDVKNMQQASVLLTLTEQMKQYIEKRIEVTPPVFLINNPSVQSAEVSQNIEREKGFVYCGNAGRLQRIPLLIEAIKSYLNQGGNLPFIFAGGGVYKSAIEQLAGDYHQVTYLGVLPADKAAQLLNKYTFGLMPIEDEVTDYAFPSKSSSYVFSGCQVIAICGENTSVAEWVKQYDVGILVKPTVDSIVKSFSELEQNTIECMEVNDLKSHMTPAYFSCELEKVIFNA